MGIDSVSAKAKEAVQRKVVVEPPPPPPPAPAKQAAPAAQSEFVQKKAAPVSLNFTPSTSEPIASNFQKVSAAALAAKGSVMTLTPVTATEALSATTTDPAKRAQEEADRINQQAKTDPAGAARAFETAINENTDEAYRQALIAGTGPAMKAIAERSGGLAFGREAEELTEAVRAVGRAAQKVGGEGAAKIADNFARGLPASGYYMSVNSSMPTPVSQAIHEGILESQGGLFGAELAKAMAAQGKTEAAAQLREVTCQAVETLRADFTAAAQEVDKANQELQRLLADVGPALTDAQKQALCEEHRKKNQGVYDAYEAAAAKLAPVMDAHVAMAEDPAAEPWERELAKQAIQETLPKLGDTKAGSEFILRAMEQQGKEGESIISKALEIGKDNQDFLTKMSVSISKSMALMAMEDAALGLDTSKVLAGFTKTGLAFGLTEEKMGELSELFGRIRPGMDADELKGINRRIGELTGDIDGFGAGPRGQALKGIGLAWNVAAAVSGAAGAGDASVAEQIKAAGDLLAAGGDAGNFVLETVFRASKSQLFSKMNGVGTAITAVVDGVQAIQAYNDGRTLGAISSGSLALGGLISAAAALGVSVPVAGQVAAGVLIVVGVGLKPLAEREAYEKNKRELFTEANKEGAITRDPALLETFIQSQQSQVSGLANLGLSPEQIQQVMRTSPTVVTSPVPLDGLQNLAVYGSLNTFQIAEVLQLAGAGQASADVGTVAFLDQLSRALVGKTSRQDVLWALQQGASAPRMDSESRKSWQAVYDYMRSLPSPVTPEMQ